MRTEIGGIVEAIEARELPLDFRGLCGEMWDENNKSFSAQVSLQLLPCDADSLHRKSKPTGRLLE